MAIFSLIAMAFAIPQPFSTGNKDDGGLHVCHSKNEAFQPGEEVTYVIYYNWKFMWIPAGEVVFKVGEKDSLYHFLAYGKTYPSYEWFYKVDDRYETYATKQDLKTVKAYRDVKEGKYKKYSELHFDRDAGKVLYRMGEGPKEIEEEAELTAGDCLQDALTILYIARNLDYDRVSKGDEIPADLILDNDSYNVQFEYGGKQKKKIKNLGKFNTVQIEPTLVSSNLFNEGDKMKIWASDDNNRLPLLIESPVSVGSIKAVLKSASGLKYPIEAQIK
jgi:hypothetical protein